MPKPIRVGLIGAGYIADWHADALAATRAARLTCVVDANLGAAESFAARRGLRAYGSIAEMAADEACDAVHVLTPPDAHLPVAKECLQAGLHVLVEKPAALSSEDTKALHDLAREQGVRLSAGHNFLGLPAYRRLKGKVKSGALGRISNAEVNWCFPLAPLRAGPYGIWLMRETKNLLQELGPHLFAYAQDLFGHIDVLSVTTSNPVILPTGETRPQSFRILAKAGKTDITLNISLVETYDDRSLVLRGSSAMARLDYANNTLVIAGTNTSDLVINPLRNALSLSWQNIREGAVNAALQLSSLNQKSPYGLSFRGMCRSVYGSLRKGTPIDPAFCGESAVAVMQAIDDAIAMLPPEKPYQRPEGQPEPTALVIGGTGFIGRALTRKLAESGTHVRVLSRGTRGPFEDISDKVELFSASLKDEAALEAAMAGIKHVYHLAKSDDKTWADALENDVGVTENIARAALAAGVERLVYTGTIASYDMSDKRLSISEETGFGQDMEERNIYARSKAECEQRLMQMHARSDLPVTIARPGIVVGKGGPLQHWGIGRWHGAGAVKLWGSGRNTLPFVLIDDVVEGLILMANAPSAIGESFNLIGEPMLSARDYFAAIHAELGAKISVTSGPLWAFYASDAVKFFLKTNVLRRRGLTRPSYLDWKSRAHFSPFDNAKPKAMLGWQPEASKEALVKKAITEANLFGF